MTDFMQDWKQKVEASQMCWMHLLPLGQCSCEFIEEKTVA